MTSVNCSEGALALSDGESEAVASLSVDRSPQPAKVNTAMAPTAATRAVFLTAPS
ncbi:MAG: hypothetical protein ACRDOX_04575 [Nocardioides sp.]